MSILLEQQDYVPDGAGSVISVSGGSAVLSDVLFRLTARRGGFALLPEFGSRMYLLRGEKPSARTSLARQYAVEALADLEDLSVTDARVTMDGTRLIIRVEMVWQGQPLAVELEG